jgi:hypothetical protein
VKPPYADNAFIVEGVMTTHRESFDPNNPQTWKGSVNIAPMGPIVEASMDRFVFRPFKTSTTYKNLKQTGQGVFHVTDDSLLIARAAVRKDFLDLNLGLAPAKVVKGLVITSSCRYFELKVVELDDREDRTNIVAQTVHSDRLRDFVGFNRARHAVLEAAILATRLHLTGVEFVLREYQVLRVMIDKTGTSVEQLAMDELTEFVNGASARQTTANTAANTTG